MRKIRIKFRKSETFFTSKTFFANVFRLFFSIAALRFSVSPVHSRGPKNKFFFPVRCRCVGVGVSRPSQSPAPGVKNGTFQRLEPMTRGPCAGRLGTKPAPGTQLWPSNAPPLQTSMFSGPEPGRQPRPSQSPAPGGQKSNFSASRTRDPVKIPN